LFTAVNFNGVIEEEKTVRGWDKKTNIIGAGNEESESMQISRQVGYEGAGKNITGKGK